MGTRRWIILVTIMLAAGGARFALAVPGEGMLLYYPLDAVDGGTIFDASGNGRDGVLVGKATVVDGRHGKALELTAPDEIQVEDTGFLDGMSALTAEVWVWMDQQQATGLIQKGTDWGANMSYLIQPWSDGKIYFGIKETSSRAITQPGDFPLSAWYHLAAVYDGATLQLYIDGDLKAEADVPKGVAAIPDTDDPLQLGNRFTGIVDDFLLYDRALSESEIRADMNGEILSVDGRQRLATMWGRLKAR